MPSYNCKHSTCPAILKERGYCEKHRHLEQKWDATDQQYDREQRDARSKQFYNSAVWLRARRWKLSHYPMCQRLGCRNLAEMVHHIRPVAEVRDTEPRLLTADENLLSLCLTCHGVIEASQKGKRKSEARGK